MSRKGGGAFLHGITRGLLRKTMRGRRRLIPLQYLFEPTRYERAQTKGCMDLRWAGPNSEVRIIRPKVSSIKGY
jgi:hypothetical protein